MYAIIESGGKQHRVALGETIRVERLDVDVGSEIPLANILLVAGQDKPMIGAPRLDDFEVIAKVVEHGRGKKIRIIKMKRRKNYRRTQGHRQDYTELQITKFGGIELQTDRAVSDESDEDET